MINDRIQTPLYLDSQFTCRNFAVHPELIGQRHQFVFRDRVVIVELPQIGDVKDHHANDPKAICQSWIKIEQQLIPTQYEIYCIEVKVYLVETPGIHPKMLVLNINQFEMLDASEQSLLDETCEENFAIAIEAYEYWLSVLRWKTKSFRIGRSAVVGNASGRTPTLCAVQPDKRVWGAPTFITAERTHLTTKSEWEAAAEALKILKIIPPHISLLQVGQEYHYLRDYRRSIIDVAIACEVFLRSRVVSSLPIGIAPAIRSTIEAVNISQFISKYFPDLLTPLGKIKFKKISKNLTSLFDARNKIMHMDNNERCSSAQCVKFIDLAEKLFELEADLMPALAMTGASSETEYLAVGH